MTPELNAKTRYPGEPEPRELTLIFERLLKGHSSLLPTSIGSALLIARFQWLLASFVETNNRTEAVNEARSAVDHSRFTQLLKGYEAALEAYRCQEEAWADNFNLLGVMGVIYDEVRHSGALAWLLDRDMRRFGTHAQGTLGFQLFLQELCLPEEYAQYPYWVGREVRGDRSRVDLEIGSRGHFLIHIENKILAEEGIDQTY